MEKEKQEEEKLFYRMQKDDWNAFAYFLDNYAEQSYRYTLPNPASCCPKESPMISSPA